MSSRRNPACLAFLAIAIALPAFAQDQFASLPLPSSTSHAQWAAGNERHLQPNAGGALLMDSAFAHGYRHGYDEGFHTGDLDIQMGRPAQVNAKPSRLRRQDREFNSAFGNKQSFQQGYAAGFNSGYSDAMAGLDYRASERVRAAAAGLNDALPQSRRQYFDEGFVAGYASAHSAQAPVMTMSPEYVEQYCRQRLPGNHPIEYCSGFGRGYVFGSAGDESPKKFPAAQVAAR
jgi:flagellar biosynthesis/type III secretory pathway protein FliH